MYFDGVSSCETNSNPTSDSYIDLNGQAGFQDVGYALTLDSGNCNPPDTVCRIQGKVAGGVCVLNSCSAFSETFIYVTNGLAPADGQPCYTNCFVPSDACYGYLSNADINPAAYNPTSETSEANCILSQCGGVYEGYSYGSSGIIVCPP